MGSNTVAHCGILDALVRYGIILESLANTAMQTTYQPEHLERWSADGPTAFDSAANYAGADLSNFYVAPVSVTRDSQLLERCNWEVVTAQLACSPRMETQRSIYGPLGLRLVRNLSDSQG